MPPLVENQFGNENDPRIVVGDNNRNATSQQQQRPSKSRANVEDASEDISAKARQLGIDVVEWSHPDNLYSPSFPLVDGLLLRDQVSLVMRKMVKKTIQDYRPLFEGMIQRVRPVDAENFRPILTEVIRQLVVANNSANNCVAENSANDSSVASFTPNLTWGKIVTAYAFGGVFANDAIANAAVFANDAVAHIEIATNDASLQLDPKTLGSIVGEVIDEVAGKWIRDDGGWESLVNHFPNVIYEESLARNLFYLFGASAAAAVGITCLKSMIN